MDVREEIRYEAGPDEVFEMLCDRGFRERVCRAIGAISYEVSVQRDGDTAHIRNQRVMPADIPDIAKRFVGDTIEVVQTEDWQGRETDGARTGRFRVEIPGKPGAVTGTVTLSPVASGAREVVSAQVQISLPMVGRRLEAEVAKGIRAALQEEGRIGTDWLAGRR